VNPGAKLAVAVVDGCFRLDDRGQPAIEARAIAQAIARELGLTLPEIEVEDFIRSGYLSSALMNYLVLLGWNPGEDRDAAHEQAGLVFEYLLPNADRLFRDVLEQHLHVGRARSELLEQTGSSFTPRSAACRLGIGDSQPPQPAGGHQIRQQLAYTFRL